MAACATHRFHLHKVHDGVLVDAAEHANGKDLLEIAKTFRAGHWLVTNKVENAYIVFAKEIVEPLGIP